jgi:hypothetical protein
MICAITGDATVQERDGQLHWLRADPAIHVASELLGQANERGLAFIKARYEIGEWCPYQPTTRHARLREVSP